MFNMRSYVLVCLLVFLLPIALARDIKNDKQLRAYKLLKGKRGTGDYYTQYSSRGSSSPSTSTYNLLGASTGGGGDGGGGGGSHYAGLVSPVSRQNYEGTRHSGHRIGYSSFPALMSLAPGTGHKNFGQGLGLQSFTLNGHNFDGASYSIPGLSNQNFAAGALFSPAGKTGPVTFGNHASNLPSNNYVTPSRATGIQGLAGSFGGVNPTRLNIPIMMDSIPGGLFYHSGGQGASSTYNIPVQSSMTTHGSSSYPTDPSNPGQSYALALQSGTQNSHIGLSSGSSDSSSYTLPISSNSYSSSDHSNSIHTPVSSEGKSYVSVASNNPSNPTNSNPLVYSSLPSSYSNPSSSYSNSNSAYLSPGSSSTYSSGQSDHSTYESQGSYSQHSPRYLGYSAANAYEGLDSSVPKYDTISYSAPNV